jgi:hypothetical protein
VLTCLCGPALQPSMQLTTRQKQGSAYSGSMVKDKKTIIGWNEWVGLHQLSLPLIRAKVDTGARTSALHAFSVDSFTERGAPWVRFSIHPLQKSPQLVVTCEAPSLTAAW